MITCFMLFYNCEKEEGEHLINTIELNKTKPTFKKLNADYTGIKFNNKLSPDLETRSNLFEYVYFYNGGGVAIGDLNNDGLSEILLTGNQVPNKLYLNKGGFQFEDISESSGLAKLNRWSTGVTFADVNGDGFLDIYISNSGPSENKEDRRNEFYLNQGDLTFIESAEKANIADERFSTQSSFFDYDSDGDLDLIVMNHADWFKKRIGQSLIDIQNDKSLLPEVSAHLYKNENGVFEDVSKEARINKFSYGLGLVTSDINDDGLVDVYMTNDFMIPDYLFINDGKGGFNESLKKFTRQISWFGMGCDVVDVNNDALLDIAVVDMTSSDHFRSKTLMPPMIGKDFYAAVNELGYQYQYMFNSLQINNGNFSFSNVAGMSGINQTDWSWATLFADFDNDGDKDNFISNGYRKYFSDNDFSTEYSNLLEKYQGKIPLEQLKDLYAKMPEMRIENMMFENLGNLEFKKVGKKWQLNHPGYSNGAAYGDLDNDGDLDLIVNNIDEEAFVYKNECSNGNYLQLDLLSKNKMADALNAKIKLIQGKNIQYQEFTTVRGYQSSVEPLIHFGLKNSKNINEIIITWPDNSSQRLIDVKASQKLSIAKTSNLAKEPRPAYRPFFAEISKATFQHIENDFNDYKREVLLPHKQSTLGPLISTGDVNNDGLDDFYIGGAIGQSGQLFIADQSGNFNAKPNEYFIKDKTHEDLGSCLFDVDMDGDLDLYVVSGGNEVPAQSSALADRLYLNNGAGVFKKANYSTNVNSSAQRVKCIDFDQDGDLDLFVGGRAIPGKYPYPDRSYLLENTDGVLKDVTSELAPDLLKPGIVTDFQFIDINEDELLDIVIVGEWMPVSFYTNTGNGFSFSHKRDDLKGWWYSISKADLDEDGDLDLILGNIGKNNKYRPKQEKPLHIFCNDFDNNGSPDIVLSKKYNNDLVPVRGMECSSEQMPFIKNKFQDFKSFANANITDLYGEEKLKEAIHLQFNFEASIILWNEKGKFDWSELPSACQKAPINGICVDDFNKDGKLDILLVGNNFNVEIETPRYDAGQGALLINQGNKKFEYLAAFKSGFFTPHDAKDLSLIKTGNLKTAIVSNNNGPLQVLNYK